MQLDPTTLSKIDALAQEGILLLEQLDTILAEELVAFQQRDIDAIRSTFEQKANLLGLFDKNNKQRADCMAKAGVSLDKSGIDQLAQLIPSQTIKQNFQAHWATLEQKLKTVMAANQRNELVLMRNKQSLDKLLSLLRGKPQANTLYTASGSKGDYSSQSHLGKA
jgi:flagellar biosynthesis/type III secretory pathway chaperone